MGRSPKCLGILPEFVQRHVMIIGINIDHGNQILCIGNSRTCDSAAVSKGNGDVFKLFHNPGGRVTFGMAGRQGGIPAKQGILRTIQPGSHTLRGCRSQSIDFGIPCGIQLNQIPHQDFRIASAALFIINRSKSKNRGIRLCSFCRNRSDCFGLCSFGLRFCRRLGGRTGYGAGRNIGSRSGKGNAGAEGHNRSRPD